MLMVTISVVCAWYVIVPISADGLVQAEVPAGLVLAGPQRNAPPGPSTVVSASSDSGSVAPCSTHAVWVGMVTDVTGG